MDNYHVLTVSEELKIGNFLTCLKRDISLPEQELGFTNLFLLKPV